MKKAGLLFISLAFLMHSKAQVSVGIDAGYTASNIDITGAAAGDFGQAESLMKTFHGWHLDLMINVPLANGFYFQPVIRYITKGSGFSETRTPKTELDGLYIPKGARLQLNYLEIPLNFVYKLPLGPGNLRAGLGPYAARGLKGRYHYDIVKNGQSITQNSKKVQFSREANDNIAVVRMHPWDAGANFTLGYEFNNGLMLGANYSMGLTDIDRSDFTESKNRYLGISLGFLFNREDY
ncbi:PorT family protein [Chitinophaga lutea]|uniref:PorT family protein n=1 Tax=Chitinophaga lutea TaxID=2488634 RepID=A0A3N4QCM8_9BACT|nr:porin family protein [Chitinophaga lutea]RPE13730.1 PorT family protein [Chitinophaga lutea]